MERIWRWAAEPGGTDQSFWGGLDKVTNELFTVKRRSWTRSNLKCKTIGSYSRLRRPSRRRRLLPRRRSLALEDTNASFVKKKKVARKCIESAANAPRVSAQMSLSTHFQDILGVKWETTILRHARRKTVCADTRLLRKAMYSSTTAWLRPTHGSLWGTKTERRCQWS